MDLGVRGMPNRRPLFNVEFGPDSFRFGLDGSGHALLRLGSELLATVEGGLIGRYELILVEPVLVADG